MRPRLPYFDEFDPFSKDAVIKFAVDCLLDYDPQRLREFMGPEAESNASKRLSEKGINEGINYLGISGDGGWTLRRAVKPFKSPDNKDDDWPDWADYRAYVEPEEYYLEHPKGFYDEATFKRYLMEGLREYIKAHPDKRKEIEQLVKDLEIGILE